MTYAKSQITKKRILDAGLDAWPQLSYRNVGAIAGLDHGTVRYHFPTPPALNKAIAEHAVDMGNKRVIRFLIAEEHAAISDMSDFDLMEYYS